MAKKKPARRPAPRKRAAASRTKRKPARPARRRTAVRASGRAAKARAASRRIKKTPAGRRATKAAATRKVAKKVARKAAKKVARKAVSRPARKKTSRKPAAKASTRKISARKASKTASPPARVKTAAQPRKTAGPKRGATPTAQTAPARPRPARAPRPQRGPAPGLNRERRTLVDDDVASSPPSSFGFEPRASSAHSGGRELHEKFTNHPGDTGPGITGGDVDGDWESAYTVGDEAPGGDNPTPDQDLVDEIGRAVGVQYEDDEELEGEQKISERDRHRWEYDPASSDDWKDRED